MLVLNVRQGFGDQGVRRVRVLTFVLVKHSKLAKIIFKKINSQPKAAKKYFGAKLLMTTSI
jgi:hypothetical protein